MAEKKLYELAHKDTGFHDHETGFTVLRDQRKELGSPIGKATAMAILKGRLIRVDSESDDASDASSQGDAAGQQTTPDRVPAPRERKPRGGNTTKTRGSK